MLLWIANMQVHLLLVSRECWRRRLIEGRRYFAGHHHDGGRKVSDV